MALLFVGCSRGEARRGEAKCFAKWEDSGKRENEGAVAFAVRCGAVRCDASKQASKQAKREWASCRRTQLTVFEALAKLMLCER